MKIMMLQSMKKLLKSLEITWILNPRVILMIQSQILKDYLKKLGIYFIILLGSRTN